MIAGARVEVAPYKKNSTDFVLWKPTDPRSNIPLPKWKSPRHIETPGRPGWHIECSAMAWKYLTETFDIHAGGIDLIFPHHENEIAQSRCAFHTSLMARYWLHNGFLQVEGEKMSKSLGNFVTIRELLETDKFGGHRWPGTIVRLAMLMSHYRQPLDWTLDRLQEAQSRRTRWLGPPLSRGVPEKGRVSVAIVAALEDDLDSVAALSVLDELRARAHSPREPMPADVANDLAASMLWLGIATDEDFVEARADSEDIRFKVLAAVVGLDPDDLKKSIDARNAARKARDFRRADHIRDELAAKGIWLRDNPDGTTTPEVKR
jgi:cysteinyl-tRNA synthetase